MNKFAYDCALIYPIVSEIGGVVYYLNSQRSAKWGYFKNIVNTNKVVYKQKSLDKTVY